MFPLVIVWIIGILLCPVSMITHVPLLHIKRLFLSDKEADNFNLNSL